MSYSAGFDRLFIFEIANNHMGNVKHGLNIIREISKVSKVFDFKFAFKLQYRDLDTFIHPDFKGRANVKYVKRFEETRLNEDELKILKDEIKDLGFISICTPFDENSVDLIEKHDFSIIKIGSCSFDDWPLLERIVKTDKPIILSLGGAPLEAIDKVVLFLEHRKKTFSLMHCVGEYPAPVESLQLNQIDFMHTRYPDITIGYSGHEEPDDLDPIKIAVAKGALVFERHVGIETELYKLNKYSSTPKQIEKWLSSAKDAFTVCGLPAKERCISKKEKADLMGLKRGVFAKKAMAKDERVGFSNTFFAIPAVEGQLLANDLSKYSDFSSKKEIKTNEPIMLSDVLANNLRDKVLKIINDVKNMIIKSKINIPDRVELELSHHYGIDNFEKFGAAIINCINREYCKKLIIMLPNQKHPSHYHKKKEETFHVLYGDISLNLNGVEKEHRAGEMVIVERGLKHSFSSKKGVVFEEISTTHLAEDSFYDDEKIVKNKNRKTEMTFWSEWLTKSIS